MENSSIFLQLSHPVLSDVMILSQALWHLLFFFKKTPAFETGQLHRNPSFHLTATITQNSTIWTLVVTGKVKKTCVKCSHNVQKPEGRVEKITKFKEEKIKNDIS